MADSSSHWNNMVDSLVNGHKQKILMRLSPLCYSGTESSRDRARKARSFRVLRVSEQVKKLWLTIIMSEFVRPFLESHKISQRHEASFDFALPVRPKLVIAKFRWLIKLLVLLLVLSNDLLKLPTVEATFWAHSNQEDQQDRQDEPDLPTQQSDYYSHGDNSTKIPMLYVDSDGGQPNMNPTETITKRPNVGNKQRTLAAAQPINRQLYESELLPFADFNVQQPAFSDLMKSWPPTTLQAASVMIRKSASSGRRSGASQEGSRSVNTPQSHKSGRIEPDDETMIGNHLNEDLDDTIVTADQSFDHDQLAEPPSWINYLNDIGDYIYAQLKHFQERSRLAIGSDNVGSSQVDNGELGASSDRHQTRIEAIDELLDDYYYGQYENSQVLYYGPQLVREGDILEIGCYMPLDQLAEWTKSGRPLSVKTSSPRMIRRRDFLGAKQNFSLKIFEASVNDSGNYRCNHMSRKYHKLIVVPLKMSAGQLYMIQQRLLLVVNPRLTTPVAPDEQPVVSRLALSRQQSADGTKQIQHRDYLLPGHVIVENKPLLVGCEIGDELAMRRLHDNPQFQLAWYKNGKLLKNSLSGGQLLTYSTNNNQSPGARLGGELLQQQTLAGSTQTPSVGRHLGPNDNSNQRIQFVQPNGRQMYITSALYSDAGDYLCSWSKLATSKQQKQANSLEGESGSELSPPLDEDGQSEATATSSIPAASGHNPLAGGSLLQLMAPVKLRPFKSSYHVRQGNELRLVCLAQRGYPAAHMNWYVGNRLVDDEFLTEHREFRVIQWIPSQGQVLALPNDSSHSEAQLHTSDSERRRIVEINPIPLRRQHMQLTTNGRGQWIEYHDSKNEKYAIDSTEQILRYLQQKLSQLLGLLSFSTGGRSEATEPSSFAFGQASLSVLVVNSLHVDRHTSRYACRATTRANTDEVTTVIRVQTSTTVISQPTSGKATLVPGQPLYLRCGKIDYKDANFWWYKKNVGESREWLLKPDDDSYEIHNDRLTLVKTTSKQAGDYYCRALIEGAKDSTDPREFAMIQVRLPPYIDDFGVETSHTGRSSILTDGDRLELICNVRDYAGPVNITWLRSTKPDDDHTMVPIPEVVNEVSASQPGNSAYLAYAPEHNVIVESLGPYSKKLVIESVRQEHRGHYACMADNGVTERTRKVIFIRVRDKLIALWPFLGIVAELVILFTIIHIWETQRAYKELQAVNTNASTAGKRPPSGPSSAGESVPLNIG